MTSQPLFDWWMHTAQDDAQKVVPKAAEYGSESLVALGRTVEGLMGSEGHGEASASEVAIFVYLTGKMARWAAAIKRGDRVSDDTLLDITTYSMMARRIRDAGSWPGETDTAQVVDSERSISEPEYPESDGTARIQRWLT